MKIEKRAEVGSTWEGPRGDRWIVVEDHHESGFYRVRLQRVATTQPVTCEVGDLIDLDDSAMYAYCRQIEAAP